jgi:hypothetical protein
MYSNKYIIEWEIQKMLWEVSQIKKIPGSDEIY